MKRALQLRKIEEYRKHDMSFHLTIAYSCHNRYLIHMYITICNLMDQFMKEVFTVIPDLVSNSFAHHTRIFESIKKGEPKLTVRYIREHIGDIEKSLENYYKDMGMRG